MMVGNWVVGLKEGARDVDSVDAAAVGVIVDTGYRLSSKNTSLEASPVDPDEDCSV